jgi:hypothetical protein
MDDSARGWFLQNSFLLSDISASRAITTENTTLTFEKKQQVDSWFLSQRKVLVQQRMFS